MSLLKKQQRCQQATVACQDSVDCSVKMEFLFYSWSSTCAATTCSTYTTRGDCCWTQFDTWNNFDVVGSWRDQMLQDDMDEEVRNGARLAVALVDCLDTLQDLDLFSYDILESQYAALLTDQEPAAGPGRIVVTQPDAADLMKPASSSCTKMRCAEGADVNGDEDLVPCSCDAATSYANSIGGCVDKTDCGASEYISSPGDGYTDRICMELTTCTSSQYESGRTDRGDVECEDLTFECSLDEITALGQAAASSSGSRLELLNAPATTVVVDMTVSSENANIPEGTRIVSVESQTMFTLSTTLEAGTVAVGEFITFSLQPQFEERAPTATSDRVCTFLRECDLYDPTAPTYQTRAPTSTRNRECGVLTACNNDEWESTSPTVTSDRDCTERTACIVGTTYQTSAGDATTDRTVRIIHPPPPLPAPRPVSVVHRICFWLTRCQV
eukprot:SAG31_NODE_1_length_62978_cov_30.836130_29_plen_442_part_00